MNRMELIRRIAEKHEGVRIGDIEAAVGLILRQMKYVLASGDRIEIRGFGSFATTIHRARKARNPKTGEKIEVPEKLVPRFRPGKELRDVKMKKKAEMNRTSQIRKEEELRAA